MLPSSDMTLTNILIAVMALVAPLAVAVFTPLLAVAVRALLLRRTSRAL